LISICRTFSRFPSNTPLCFSRLLGGTSGMVWPPLSLPCATCYHVDPIFLVTVPVSSCISYHLNHIHASTRSYPVNDPYFVLCVISVCRFSANGSIFLLHTRYDRSIDRLWCRRWVNADATPLPVISTRKMVQRRICCPAVTSSGLQAN